MSPDRDTFQVARQLLSKTFGFKDFMPGQEAVVERILAGRSVLAIFPTGGGKATRGEN